MHLLLVVPAYAPFVGGAQTFCRAMARRLVADGHQVIILTTAAQQADDFWHPPPSIRDALPRCEQMDGVQVIRLPLAYPWPVPWRFGWVRRATHLFARLPLPSAWQKPLLRHFTRSMPSLLGLQLELSPLVAAADLILVVDAGWDGLFVGAAQAAFVQTKPVAVVPLIHMGSRAIIAHFDMAHQVGVYQQADAVVALSLPERVLLARWGVDQARLHCLSMGVETVDIDEVCQNREAVLRQFGLSQRFILFLGAATYDKGAFTLVQAVAELVKQGESVEIVCAGPQQHQLAVFMDIFPPQIRSILKKRVHLLGVVDEQVKQALLAGCTALALPSRVDSFGIVLLEAWQHGKPVVAAATGGPSAIVRHEETGLLVPFGASDALAAALQRILNEPGLAARLGAAGRQVVTNQYTWDKCYDALRQIFNRIHSAVDDSGTKSNPIGRSDERL